MSTAAQKAQNLAEIAEANGSAEVVAKSQTGLSFTDQQLGQITSIDDALSALADAGLGVSGIEDFGSGFVLTDKDQLKGAEMLLLQWRFSEGDFGPFVSVAALTRDGRRVIFNDGSTGIYKQLRTVTLTRLKNGETNMQAGLTATNGLKESTYTYEDEKGVKRPASTYYLS